MTSYDHILHAYVKAGVVDYASISRPAPRAALERFLKTVGSADLVAEGDAKAQNAAWINVFNALVIDSVVAGNDPAIPKFFKVDSYQVFGKDVTLDAVRKQALKEPRAVFALTPGAIGSPKLRSEVYVGAHLDAQLEDQARGFLGDPKRNQFTKPTAHLSPIFSWFGTPREVLVKYAPVAAKAWLPKAKVSYGSFDWHLNGKAP
ncbi:MAG: hypothetical protein JWM80_3816 [Cyanobacteria bacterium RYN_339]|nr:hypothetical protein [Cyanobacteria bacterium RYN_339]